MDCYIVCNMFPPLVSDVVRAPGLRAQQLAQQAALKFDRVRYVMTKSRYDMLTKSHTVCHGLRSHPDFIVVHDSYLHFFIERLERSVFVFTQLEMDAFFRQAQKRHYVVYDMLASKTLELRCGDAKPKQVAIFEERQRRFTDQADRVLVNAEKLQELESEILNQRRDEVINNPFCPVPPQIDGDAPARDHILFFSAAQPWTNNAAFLRAMADYLSDRPNLPAYFMTSLKGHENPESISISRLQQMPNVRRMSALSYPAHQAVLARCMAAMDWSAVNDERRYSTSTRLIQAVGSGAALFGNADTGLDNYWGGYPGATSETEPDAQLLGDFIDKATSGAYAGDLRRAADWNKAVLNDRKIFGGIQ